MDIQNEDDYVEEADNSYEDDYESESQLEQKPDGESSIAGLTLNQYLHVAHDGVSIRFTERHCEKNSQSYKKVYKKNLGVGVNDHHPVSTQVRQKFATNKDVYPSLLQVVKKSTKKSRVNARAFPQNEVAVWKHPSILAPKGHRCKALERRSQTNSNRGNGAELVARTVEIAENTFPKLAYSPSMQSVLNPGIEYASKLPLL